MINIEQDPANSGLTPPTVHIEYDELGFTDKNLLLAGLRRDKYQGDRVKMSLPASERSPREAIDACLAIYRQTLLDLGFKIISINDIDYNIGTGAEIVNEQAQKPEPKERVKYKSTKEAITEIEVELNKIKLSEDIRLQVDVRVITIPMPQDLDDKNQYLLITINDPQFGDKELMRVAATYYNDGDDRGPESYAYTYQLEELIRELRAKLKKDYSKFLA